MGRCLNKLVLLICALLMQFLGAPLASSAAAADATTATTFADASTAATARAELDKVGDEAT